MGDFDDLTIDDLSDIVSADKLREMGCQADAWQGLAYLFDSQLARLREAVDALSGGWRGPAGAAFAAEVGRIQQTLTRGREVALGNASAWSQAVDQATAARDVIYQIEGEYRAALGQAASDYERQKAEADSSWLNNPATGFFVDYPDKPDAAAIRAEYDQRGRAVMEYASGVYEEVYRTIQDAPAYDGPAGVWSPVDPWGDGMVLSGRSSRLSGTSGTPPLNAPVDLGNAPTGSAGPTLAGTAIPAAPAQVGTNPAAAALPGTGSPGTAGMGGLFPSTMTGTGRSTP
ncbi:MAG: hypothetical protein JXA67_03715, partial [Micromonosporaceae bacterium]|nr:hypothetical protein [Micromonosporaceae bacterium]